MHEDSQEAEMNISDDDELETGRGDVEEQGPEYVPH